MKGWALLFNNALLVASLVAILAGCWIFSPAVAFIVTGVLGAGVAVIKGLPNANSR